MPNKRLRNIFISISVLIKAVKMMPVPYLREKVRDSWLKRLKISRHGLPAKIFYASAGVDFAGKIPIIYKIKEIP